MILNKFKLTINSSPYSCTHKFKRFIYFSDNCLLVVICFFNSEFRNCHGAMLFLSECLIYICHELNISYLNTIRHFVISYPEIFMNIFSLMCISDLVIWASVNKHFRFLCQTEYRIRYQSVVGRFVDNILSFSHTLLSTRTVISGSAVLFSMNPSNSLWFMNIKDLDLYTCLAHAPRLLCYLQFNENYVQTGSREVERRAYYSSNAIRQVINLVRPHDGSKIDVIISSSMYGSTLPIFQFHSTIVMNFMTPNILFCAYPFYTLEKKGLINWTVITNVPPDGASGPVNLSDRARVALKKYKKRGYILGLSPFRWDKHHRVICRFGGDCRGIRSTVDSDNLIFPFGQSLFMDDAISYNWENILPGGHVQWSIGGSDCIVLWKEINYQSVSNLISI